MIALARLAGPQTMTPTGAGGGISFAPAWALAPLNDGAAWSDAAPSRLTVTEGWPPLVEVAATFASGDIGFDAWSFGSISKNGAAIAIFERTGSRHSDLSVCTVAVPVVAGDWFEVVYRRNNVGGPTVLDASICAFSMRGLRVAGWCGLSRSTDATPGTGGAPIAWDAAEGMAGGAEWSAGTPDAIVVPAGVRAVSAAINGTLTAAQTADPRCTVLRNGAVVASARLKTNLRCVWVDHSAAIEVAEGDVLKVSVACGGSIAAGLRASFRWIA
jgi:hypothetical protein